MSFIRFVSIIILTLSQQIGFSQTSSHFGAPKFVPASGERLLILGQDMGSVGGHTDYTDGYINYTDHYPAGVTTYTGITNLGGLKGKDNWGSGDLCAQCYLEDSSFDNSTIAIGLYMVNQLNNIRNGVYDNRIEELGQWIIDSNRPIFLRIGYEFDGPWNGYDPDQFKDAWIHIVKLFDELGVRNVAYVWQSAGINTNNIGRWYPGDEYVNWAAYSHFDGSNHGQATRDFADHHNKPIMIAESTPRLDLHRTDGVWAWDNWFEPLFKSIDEHSNIRALAYINADWDNQPQWQGQGWGDSRVQINTHVFEQWMNEVGQDHWLLASEHLFDHLQYQLWEDSIMDPPLGISPVSEFEISKRNGKILIQSLDQPIKELQIITISGQILLSSEVQTHEVVYAPLLDQSIYIVRVRIGSTVQTRKVHFSFD